MLLADDMSGVFGLGIGVVFLLIYAVIGLIGLISLIIWILMLIDAVTNPSLSSNERLLWILLMVFVGIIPSIVYYFVVKRR